MLIQTYAYTEIVGAFLIVRRMALLGDVVAHAVLLGLAIAME